MPFTAACVASTKRIPRKPVMIPVDFPSVFDRSSLSPSSPVSPGPLTEDLPRQTPPGLFDITGAYSSEIAWEIQDDLISSTVRFRDAEEAEEDISLEDDDEDNISVERIFGQSLQRSRRQASLATIASPRTSSSFSTPSTPALSRCDSQSSLSSLEQADDSVSIARSPSTSSIGSVHRRGQHVRSSRWTDHSSELPGAVLPTEFGADSLKDDTPHFPGEPSKTPQTVEKPKRSFGLLRFGSGRPSSSSSSSRDSSPGPRYPCRDSVKPSVDCSPSPSASILSPFPSYSSYSSYPPYPSYPSPAPASISSAHALFSASLPLIHIPTNQFSIDGASSSTLPFPSPVSPLLTKESKLKPKTQTFSYLQRRPSSPPSTLFGLKELRELRLAAEVLQSAARSRVDGLRKVASEKGRVKRKAVPIFVLGSDDNGIEASETTDATIPTLVSIPAVPKYFHLPQPQVSRLSSLPPTPDDVMPPMAIARPRRGFLGQSNKSVRTSVAFVPRSMKTGKGIYLGVDGCDEGLQSIHH
ncbi:hypothetical protein [Phaffia rhodozyma]|uniref:Uncharacterized protein n=1 Tax=Phaffia rhodozyma TaxID=264483 RepID=A0A0F7SRY4_PHARH|nr:hypothetical protein [Phaffia rhodozyma]